MHISRFSIKNYKSFFETGDIKLTTGINIITGQNNAGKTAMLEALSLRFEDKRHRSTKTEPTVLSKNTERSEVNIDFELNNKELKDLILNQGSQFYMPALLNEDNKVLNGDNFFSTYFNEINTIQAHFINGNLHTSNLKFAKPINPDVSNFFSIDRLNRSVKLEAQTSKNADVSNAIIQNLVPRVYCFKAERFKVGSSNTGINKVLNTDASNLPEVLNIIQGDPVRFERYNRFVRKIFPQIFLVTTRPISQTNVEILIWNEDPNLERSDLAISLSECGTGLSQALAILYVVLTSDTPRIIIIDEPNSFLHPGAARKLIEILKEHAQHQFIISTHSPSTLAASNPSTIHMVKIKDAQSFVDSINITDANNQQLYLAEIGAKLSDVFGADDILWVEGKTEEVCFRKIIEATKGVSLMGTVVLSVINTGDFQRKKNAKTIFEIYKKLSLGKGLLPPAVGFVFDSENLTSLEKKNLEKESNNSVVFTSRKMFENYLLNPEAILSVLSSIPDISDLRITLTMINQWLDSNKWNKKYISRGLSTSKSEAEWIIHVDGAKILSDLFSEVTETRLSFDKIKHSVSLCEWTIENSFNELIDIQLILKRFLKREQA